MEQGERLPGEYIVPNPYNIPVHDQGNKNSCTAHAPALMMEYQLSDYFKERTLIAEPWGQTPQIFSDIDYRRYFLAGTDSNH